MRSCEEGLDRDRQRLGDAWRMPGQVIRRRDFQLPVGGRDMGMALQEVYPPHVAHTECQVR